MYILSRGAQSSVVEVDAVGVGALYIPSRGAQSSVVEVDAVRVGALYIPSRGAQSFVVEVDAVRVGAADLRQQSMCRLYYSLSLLTGHCLSLKNRTSLHHGVKSLFSCSSILYKEFCLFVCLFIAINK
jgi:hypothetical protein